MYLTRITWTCDYNETSLHHIHQHAHILALAHQHRANQHHDLAQNMPFLTIKYPDTKGIQLGYSTTDVTGRLECWPSGTRPSPLLHKIFLYGHLDMIKQPFLYLLIWFYINIKYPWVRWYALKTYIIVNTIHVSIIRGFTFEGLSGSRRVVLVWVELER